MRDRDCYEKEGPCCPEGPCRENAKTWLHREARRLRDQAHGLEKLADAIEHIHLDQDADEVLFKMVEHMRRGRL